MGEPGRRAVLHGMVGVGFTGLASLGGCLGAPSAPATREESESDRSPGATQPRGHTNR